MRVLLIAFLVNMLCKVGLHRPSTAEDEVNGQTLHYCTRCHRTLKIVKKPQKTYGFCMTKEVS